jgi:hypothetical protein
MSAMELLLRHHIVDASSYRHFCLEQDQRQRGIIKDVPITQEEQKAINLAYCEILSDPGKNLHEEHMKYLFDRVSLSPDNRRTKDEKFWSSRQRDRQQSQEKKHDLYHHQMTSALEGLQKILYNIEQINRPIDGSNNDDIINQDKQDLAKIQEAIRRIRIRHEGIH